MIINFYLHWILLWLRRRDMVPFLIICCQLPFLRLLWWTVLLITQDQDTLLSWPHFTGRRRYLSRNVCKKRSTSNYTPNTDIISLGLLPPTIRLPLLIPCSLSLSLVAGSLSRSLCYPCEATGLLLLLLLLNRTQNLSIGICCFLKTWNHTL